MSDTYSWLKSLDLLVWEEGNVAFSPQAIKEEHKGGNVWLAHFISVAKRVDLSLEGRSIRHPPALVL